MLTNVVRSVLSYEDQT